jgi:adenosylcobinamide-GDP ribazoletransferase
VDALRRHISLFFLALGFLTRLGPSRVAKQEDMSSACAYYPAIGGVLGFLFILPTYFGAFSGHPEIQSLIVVCMSAWLTRSLHLDGLADVCDALGAAQGRQFHAALKDSRLGVFGVVGLILCIAAQLLLTAACFSAHRLAPIIAAPVLGRCMPISLAVLAPAHPQASLGILLSHAPRASCLFFAAIAAVATCLYALGFVASLAAFLLCFLALRFLARAAKQHGGYNGDFLGCSIAAGELAVLIAALL